MTTQPAGEHHTGTLNLTGEGNAPDFTVDALHDEICRTYGAIWSPDNLAEILARHGWAKASETRQQVAEEIAAAIEQSEDRARQAETTEGIAGNKTYAATWSDIATGYMRSAELAREIGGTA